VRRIAPESFLIAGRQNDPASMTETIPVTHKTRSACVQTHNAVIRVYDEAGNVIETHEHAGEFKESRELLASRHAFR
jgi:hypothetical protein